MPESLQLTNHDLFAIEGELCRRSLLEYTRRAWPLLEPGRELVEGWVLEAICEHLEAVTTGDIKRLLINVPPGSMKSLLVRVFWPTWEWTIDPTNRYIGASYAESLAERDNRRAKNIVLSDWYLTRFGVTLSKDQATKTNFENTKTGWMKATSVEGIGTGERGTRFIIDDPHNVIKAESEAERTKALTWFRETVPSRLNELEKDAIITVMQRVHQEDISAVALELDYEHLLIPMHYDPDRTKPTSIGWRDPRTNAGELMWPERFSAGAVRDLERVLGAYASAAQLEQEPVPRSGGLFKTDKINRIYSLPEGEEFFEARGWDLAAGEGEGAFTAGVKLVYAMKSQRWIFVDVQRDRLGPDGVRRLIKRTAKDDGEEVMIRIPQDPGQAGKAQARSIVASLSGYKIRAELQSGSKETRADPLAAQVEAGNVDVLDRHWTKEFLEELRFFPRGKYKDQVDAAASAFNAIAPLVFNDNSSDDWVIGGGKQENWAKVI